MKSIIGKLKTYLNQSNTNLIVAGGAVVISECALFISIQEVHIMRIQQKATMYPYLTVGTTYNGDGFGIVLKNSGNGLAKINSYKVFNDSIYFKEWLDILEVLMPEAENIGYGTIKTAGNIRNLMIAPGEEKVLIFLNWTPETRILEQRIRSLQVLISYESLLDEHWRVEGGIPKYLDKKENLEMEKEFGS